MAESKMFLVYELNVEKRLKLTLNIDHCRKIDGLLLSLGLKTPLKSDHPDILDFFNFFYFFLSIKIDLDSSSIPAFYTYYWILHCYLVEGTLSLYFWANLNAFFFSLLNIFRRYCTNSS